MLHETLQACIEEKMSVSVVNIPQIKPLPKEQIIREVKKTGGAVVVEEHSYIGGLSESISSLLSENYPIPIKKVCVDDIFPVSIRMEEQNVYEKFGISARQITKAAKLIINQR
jgi:transketolase